MSALKGFGIGGTLAAAALFAGVTSSAGDDIRTCSGRYTIQKGNSLLRIAHDQLGSALAVNDLIAANLHVLGLDPDLIFPGTRLVIPCAAAVAPPIDWAVMPDVDTLVRAFQDPDLQVLDIRDTAQLRNGLIPGAMHVPATIWRSADDTALTAAALSEVLGLTGLRLRQPIIIVASKPSVDDLTEATAVMTQLRAAGAPHVAILRDGYRGWYNARLPIVATPALKDPYEIDVTLADGGDAADATMRDLALHPSSYWQSVAERPPPQSPLGFLARLVSM